MNHHIRELLQQAGVNYVTMPKDTVYEKFANLIIEDCVRTLINNSYSDAAQCLHDVHFGIDDAP